MCKICGNDTVKKTICNQEYDFCPICGFLAKDDKCIPDSKSEYERYLKHNNDDNDGYYKYQHKFYLEIKDFLGELNLDFGCGEGKILSKILNENSLNTVGYDLYFHPDVNYKKHLYNAIILEEVIEHLYNPKEILNELLMLLKEKGNIIIRTRFIPINIFEGNWWYLRDITHISFFDLKTFLYLCEHFNLKIIYCNDKDLIVLQKKE